MRDPSPYAGQTVKLRADAVELGGLDIAVVDWYQRTGDGRSWRAEGNTDPRAEGYRLRRGRGDNPLPDDDDVLFGRVDGMGALVHVTEIEGAAPAQPSTGPSLVDDRAIGQDCPACGTALAASDQVATYPIGPGADPQERAFARAGQPYQAVHIQLHWACATGDESYTTAEA